jgi:predicted aspartyl protease
MPHESGSVNSSLEAIVSIRLVGAQAVECLIDTGFDGGLLLPGAVVASLQLVYARCNQRSHS